ncbi:MAG: hypothetical protein ACTH9B_15655, partial [Brevibacterium aurantiacum]
EAFGSINSLKSNGDDITTSSADTDQSSASHNSASPFEETDATTHVVVSLIILAIGASARIISHEEI